MKTITRREVLAGPLAVGTAAALSRRSVLGANDRIIVGMMGLGGRGTRLAELFAARGDIEIAYLCDCDTRRFARARQTVQEYQKRRPELVQDFRRVLDDAKVDVLINATPDHWHGLGTILACQAGKDVYVEKPLCHNIWEGRKMVEAARKYDRVVQVGIQSRSAAYASRAREYIRSGAMGDIYFVRVLNMMKHPMRKNSPAQPVPEGLDYDMWCGPAPKVPYNQDRRWLDEWEFSCGAIAGDAVHQIDLARFLIDDPPYPETASNSGGILVLKDGRTMPDTQLATFEYGPLTFVLDAALWMPYMKKTPATIRDSDQFPEWSFNSTRVEVFGTEGFMFFGRHGGGWQAFDVDGQLVKSDYGRQGDQEHLDNFIDSIRHRKRPQGDVEIAHHSTLLCHLANISYRVGNRKLGFDPKTETFLDCDEADRWIRREYRAPWIVPEHV